MITLSKDGGSVRICERTRLFGYEIGVTIDAADWMIGILEELKKKVGQQTIAFKRFFRNSSGSLFIECFDNSKGAFLKISTLKNNRVKMVIIPEEVEAKGWSDLYECLFGVLKRKPESLQDGVTRRKFENHQALPRQQGGEKLAWNATNQHTWVNVVKNSLKNAPKATQFNRKYKETEQGNAEGNKAHVEHPSRKIKGLGKWDFLPKVNGSFRPKNEFTTRRMKQNNFHEYKQAKQCEKDWKKAVIMFRDNSGLSWSCIFYNISRELGRKLQVSQLFDDRVIIWCNNETEVENFVEIGNWFIPGTGDTRVSFKRWSAEEQNRDIKIECRGSWIGVKGLPLNLWNMKIMRKIGDLCGGLLDIEKDTAKMNFLNHLRIKLEGDNKGFVPEFLHFEFENSVIKLELFKLNDLGYKFSSFFNTCWHQDFEISKVIEEEDGCDISASAESELLESESRNSPLLQSPELMAEEESPVDLREEEDFFEIRAEKHLLESVALCDSRWGEVSKEKKFKNNGEVDFQRIFSRIFMDLNAHVDRSPSIQILISPNDTWSLHYARGPSLVVSQRETVYGLLSLILCSEDRMKHISSIRRRGPISLGDTTRKSITDKALYRKENTRQIFNEFLNCHIRSVKAKARYDFKTTVIFCWKDFEIQTREVKNSVLQYSKVEEQADSGKPKKMTKEAIDEIIDEESQFTSSDSEDSEDDVSISEEDGAKAEEDIICDLIEL
ncbi:hypothetical protein F8388_016260 [Cannabis sativa]|uniref:DUF4283 domain-containing protein n=1 Tax=Cannabis sativa TaxID=3483 RepID=A0A7J6FUA0_CANSA|nr:hypothetical protein G4B88_022049 [Cannabis sativa]KAF4381304.1 hypothetical protein F8388_016260 [Cannabis sativa]